MSADLEPAFFTDHSLLRCVLAVRGRVCRGRGVWRLKCTLLEDRAVVEAFERHYEEW